MATRTWHGEISNLWHLAGNWAENAIPTVNDDVVFDETAHTYTISCGSTTTQVATITAAGAGANAVSISGTNYFDVASSLVFRTGDSLSFDRLRSISGTTPTITQGGATFTINNVFFAVNSTVTLGSDFVVSGSINIYNTAVFVTGNYAVTAGGTFGDFGQTSAKTITLGTSTITCAVFNFGATNLTITSTAHTIVINSNSATENKFGGYSWGIVNFKSNASTARAHAITFGDGATFVQFNIDQLTDRRDCSISFSGDFSISDSSTWISGGTVGDGRDPTYRLLIKSSTIGTTRTCTVSAASKTITITDVDLQDIKIADTNSPTVTLTRVGDCGGNTTATAGGYIQNVSDPKTVYLDYGTTSPAWTATCWATSSGGGDVSNNNYPLPQDTAVIDNNSFDTTSRVIGIAGVRVANIDASALTEAQVLEVQSGGVYYGNINCGNSLSVRWNNALYYGTLDARVAGTLTITINAYGAVIGSWTIYSYGGTVSFGSNPTCNVFTLTRGTVDINGKTLTCTTFSSSNSNTRELKDAAGGGKIVVNGLTDTIFDMSTDTSLTISNAPDIDVGDSNNTLTAAVTLALGSTAKTFGDLAFKKHAGNFAYIITGVGHTFEDVTQETPDATYQYNSVTWPASAVANVVASYDATGTSDYKCYIQSSSAGSPAHLFDASGTNSFSYTVVQDIHVDTFSIGFEASNRYNTSADYSYTYIQDRQVALATGTITEVQVYCYDTSATGFKVGTFSKSGNNFTMRDYAELGALAAGLNVITGLSIDVVAGDYLGWKPAAGIGNPKRDLAGAGAWSYTGDAFTGSALEFILTDLRTYAITAICIDETSPAVWDADDGTNTNVSGNTGWTWPSYNKAATVSFSVNASSSELADFVEACALALSIGIDLTQTVTPGGGGTFEKTISVSLSVGIANSELADFVEACSVALSMGLSPEEFADFIESCSVSFLAGASVSELADFVEACSVALSMGMSTSEFADFIEACGVSFSAGLTTSEITDFAKACSVALSMGMSTSELADFAEACNVILSMGISVSELAEFVKACSVSTSFGLSVSLAGLLVKVCSVGIAFNVAPSEVADLLRQCSISMNISSNDSETADLIKACSMAFNMSPQVIEVALFIESLLAEMTFESVSSAIKETAAILKICTVAFSLSAATSEAADFVRACQALLSMASESSEIANRLLSLTASFETSAQVSEAADFVRACLGDLGFTAGPRSLGTVEMSSELAFALAAVVTALLMNPPTIGSTVPKREFEATVDKRSFETVVAKRLFEATVDKRSFETVVAKRLFEAMVAKKH